MKIQYSKKFFSDIYDVGAIFAEKIPQNSHFFIETTVL